MMSVLVVLGVIVGVLGLVAFLLREDSKSSALSKAANKKTGAGATAAVPAAGASTASATTATTSATSTTTSWPWWVKPALWMIVGGLVLWLIVSGPPDWTWTIFESDWATSTWLGQYLVNIVGESMANWIILGVVVGAILTTILIVTGKTKVVTAKVTSIPFALIGWMLVVVFFISVVLVPIANKFANPTPPTQTVSFFGMNTNNVAGQQRTIQVGPLEEWVLELGVVRGADNGQYRYFVCPTSNLSALSDLGRNVFISSRTSSRSYRHQFSQPARERLVREGIESVTVTYTYHVMGTEAGDPCDQKTNRY